MKKARIVYIRLLLLTLIFMALSTTIDIKIHRPLWSFECTSECRIPENYYNYRCIIPFWMDVETWLTKYPWEDEYLINTWDCSNMAAFTEWALENCGYEARIAIGWTHAWVQIKIDGVWKTYEATSRGWGKKSNRAYHFGSRTFEDIYELEEFYEDNKLIFEAGCGPTWWEVFCGEWAWWERDEAR